jgi:HK97 family phage prohead protease
VKYLNFKIKTEKADGPNQRKVFGLASVFGNKDLDGDIIDPSAFDEQFQDGGILKDVMTLWQHNWSDPIGRGTAKLTTQGIEFDTTLAEGDPTAEKALNLASQGIIDSFSIGFRMLKHSFDESKDALIIQKAKLMEVSLVTFPANPLAKVSDVKSKSEALEVERTMAGILREAGYSRKLVESALSGKLLNLGDPGDDQSVGINKLLRTSFNLNK